MPYLLIVTALWAFSFSLIGEYLAGRVDSDFAVLVRVLIAALVFLPFTLWRGLPRRMLAGFWLAGALQFGITYLCLYRSFQVLTVPEVAATQAAGGRIVVSPNFDASVVQATRARGLISLPGVFTPSEAFDAVRAGASGVKLFPAEVHGPAGLRALRAVLPAQVLVFPVGGVSAGNLAQWRTAGASGATRVTVANDDARDSTKAAEDASVPRARSLPMTPELQALADETRAVLLRARQP